MSANIDVFSPPRNSTLTSKVDKRIEELEQAVSKLSLQVSRLQSDVKEDPWKRPGHPWNQSRNPRHLPK
jgi:RNA processing factor Prp31